MRATDPIRTKFREAKYHLERLTDIEKMKEFYPTVNAFLSAARSVLSVACHELGWKERLSCYRTGFTTNQEGERKQYDAWFESSTEAKAVLDHPLAKERHVVIHRSGRAGFFHVPKPIGGLAIAEGDAHGPGLVIRRGRATLPLEDSNLFFYEDPCGTRHGAVAYCMEYFQLIEAFFREVKQPPWR
ncbi:MAG: hypothetical protein HZB54_06550 [Deltaproteobacteria bacterium]|nr:hypothetical protein [Deltaproteobacteria bacterium]